MLEKLEDQFVDERLALEKVRRSVDFLGQEWWQIWRFRLGFLNLKIELIQVVTGILGGGEMQGLIIFSELYLI